MIKHMIIWKFKDEIENKEEKAIEIKKALEGLVGKIDGCLTYRKEDRELLRLQRRLSTIAQTQLKAERLAILPLSAFVIVN